MRKIICQLSMFLSMFNTETSENWSEGLENEYKKIK